MLYVYQSEGAGTVLCCPWMRGGLGVDGIAAPLSHPGAAASSSIGTIGGGPQHMPEQDPTPTKRDDGSSSALLNMLKRARLSTTNH